MHFFFFRTNKNFPEYGSYIKSLLGLNFKISEVFNPPLPLQQPRLKIGGIAHAECISDHSPLNKSQNRNIQCIVAIVYKHIQQTNK